MARKYSWDYNIFLGDDSEDVHIDFAMDEQIFIVGEIRSMDEGGKLKEVLENIKDEILSQKRQDLETFTKIIDKGVQELGEDLGSISAALSVGDVVYFVTRGNGEIYVMREGETNKLMDGEKTSSGFLKDGDYFLLTNTMFTGYIDEKRLQTLMPKTKPQKLVETLAPELKGNNDIGMIALFMQAQKDEEQESEEEFVGEAVAKKATTVGLQEDESEVVGEEIVVEESEPEATQSSQPSQQPQQPQSTQSPQPASKHSFFAKIKSHTANFKRGSSLGKKVTLGIVVILIAVLAWSVMSGNSRRTRSKFVEEVVTQQEIVDAKLSEAKDLSGLNTQKSLQLIDESKEILTVLEQEAESKNLTDVTELEELSNNIASAEQDIKKTEDGQYEVYYDLSLINGDARADSMFSDGETIVMLDNNADKVYVFDIAEKSADTYSAEAVKNATLVSLYRDEPYIYGKSIGIQKFTDKSTLEEVIPADEEWGSMKDFWIYNGNMYLLDASKDDIYKYLVAEEGYSSRRSYFGEGQAPELDKAGGMAIDASIYISAGPKLYKFVSGNRDSFSVVVPDNGDIEYDDLYTDRNLNDVYILDKDTQRVFVTDKDGEFKKQISAGFLRDARDLVVNEDSGILILTEDKIYSIKD